MNYNEFSDEIEKYLKELEIKLSEKQKEQFYKYMNISRYYNYE